DILFLYGNSVTRYFVVGKVRIAYFFLSSGSLARSFSSRMHPALNKFALENHFSDDSAVMEIYDIPNKRIIYRKAIIEKN
ncbi:MAG TPA: hypothetical protein VHY08_26650, partial [Bacillota bacterium]|nr:hypothetical protein [Bacillota bacterium]